MKLFIGTALVVATLGLGSMQATALPASPLGVSASPSTSLVEVRMTRMERRMMRRNSMMRRRNMRRPSQSGNARNPSRPPMMQNQGQTTGGPRY